MQAQTQEERDTLVLAKLGKKSVLRVCPRKVETVGDMLKRPETLQFLVNFGLCLHHTRHLGGLLDVRVRMQRL